MKSFVMKAFAGAALALVMAGCGSDAGSGTETLFVDAEAFSDGSADGTWLRVVVRQGGSNGAMLDDAKVTLTAGDGTVHELPYVDVFGIAYFKNNLAWDPSWRLRIERGTADKLEARIEGPGLTRITQPAPGSLYQRSSGTDLVVKWADDDGKRAGAVIVDLEGQPYEDQIVNEDPLERKIPASSITTVNDSARLRVDRRTTLNLAGGVAGSTFTATTRDEIDINIQ